MRSLIVVAVFAVVGVAAWVWSMSSSSIPSTVPPPLLSVPVPDAAHSLDAVPVDFAAAAGQAARSSPADGDLRRVRPVAESVGSEANLQVVAHATGAPVAGAKVHYVPPEFEWQALPPAEAQQLARLARHDQRTWFERIGRQLLTDAAGRCVVPTGQHGTQVCAMAEELYGVGYVGTDAAEPVVLELRPDRVLRVLVLDATGNPCSGARIYARIDPVGDSTHTWGLGESDGEGCFTQLHCQAYCHARVPDVRRLTAEVPGCSSDIVEVDFADPPAEVVLRLPPTGMVTVHVRDAQGGPIDLRYEVDTRVRLVALDEKPTDHVQRRDAFRYDGPVAEVQQGSEVVFPHVAFDKYVLVQRGSVAGHAEAVGPTRAQPNVELTLAEHRTDVIVTATVHNADGKARANSDLTVGYRYVSGSGTRQARTDGEGRMRCNLQSHASGKVCTVSVGSSVHDRTDPMAVILPERTLEPGINDLGDVQLAPFTVLLTGRVVADDGIDVTRTGLQIEKHEHGHWSQQYSLRPTWQEGGMFTFRSGVAAGTSMRLVIGEGPYLPVEPIEFSAGATDVKVHLRTAGTVNATFLIDEGVPHQRLSFFCRDVDPNRKLDPHAEMMERMTRGSTSPSVDGRIGRQWVGLQPGSYELTVTCSGVIEPLMRIGPIAVGAGPCRDARLVDIDLRNRLRTFEIRAAGPDGVPIKSASAYVVVKSSDKEWHGYLLRRGVVELATPNTVDVIVLASGYQMESVDGVAESRTITLRPAIKTAVEVVLPAPLPAGVDMLLRFEPQPGLGRGARLTLDNGSSMMLANFFVEEVVVDPDGRVQVPVRWPGAYEVLVTVASGGGRRSYTRQLESRSIELPSAGALQITIDEQDLQRALERLQR